MRSSFSPADQTIDPDLWLHTKDQQIGTTVRLHGRYIEWLTWDLDAPNKTGRQMITSVWLDRQTGQTYSGQDLHQTVASAKAKSLAGAP